jgi:hypothetical protein
MHRWGEPRLPIVHRDDPPVVVNAVMMMRAQHDAVADIGAASMSLPPSDVVRLRVRWRPVARRPGATAVSIDERVILRRGDL